MRLIIVESPTKSKTLSRFLGKEYLVESTMGHLRDLPSSKLGVDVEKNFKPDYVVVKGKERVVSVLKKAVKKVEAVILAADPDREGEAIAWHTAQILAEDKRPISRIVFHEITKSAIEKALKNPRPIDRNLVNAQKSRRILDRLVGYKLSPLLWKKVRRGLSAGRVQSVVVRLIVEREREIEKFTSESYWRIFAGLTIPDRRHIPIRDRNVRNVFTAELIAKADGKYAISQRIPLFCGQHTVQKTSIASEKAALGIVKDLTASWIVENLEKKESFRYPSPPFTTSTLQQTAGQKLGWSGKMTMRTAQGLYERGLITYHRTDSTQLADSAIKSMRKYIQLNFTPEYLPAEARIFKTKSKVAQEAHEAIRPTKISRREPKLKSSGKRLYDLIWRRAIACQMSPARLTRSLLVISCGNYRFKSHGQRMIFDGFLKLYNSQIVENVLPVLRKGDKLNLVSLGAIKNMTTPPSRYNEASLVRTLEQEGIGRPSTYASIISVIQFRQYVEKVERKFQPTELGEAVNGFLVKNFSSIINIPFTAQMENELDEIARGERKWVEAMKAFYAPFEKKLDLVEKNAKRVKIETPKVGRKCPKCKGDLVIRIGRFGKFIACSKFPECKYSETYVEKLEGVKCPKCGGAIVIKKSKKGRKFYGCSNYPKCDWASWRKPR